MNSNLSKIAACIGSKVLHPGLVAARMVISTLAYWHIGILATSCQDIDPAQPTGPVVQFTTSVEGETVVSRAHNDKWEPGDEVGIFMLAASGTGSSFPGMTVGNHLYTTTNTADATSVGLSTQDVPFYFPIDESGVKFVAYSPYSADLPADGVHPINVGGATAQVLNQLDLLYHATPAGTTYNRNSTSVPLEFKHQLSKITVNVSLGSGVTGVDLSDRPALSIDGTPTTGEFDLTSGTLYVYPVSTAVTPANISTGISGVATWEAILIPHTSATIDDGQRVFTFSFAGTEYKYPLPADRSFLAGQAYSYNFRITAGGTIALVTTSIVDWTSGMIAWGPYQITTNKTTSPATLAKAATTGTATARTITFTTTAADATMVMATSLQDDAVTIEKPDWLTPTLTPGSTSAATSTTAAWKTWTLTYNVARNYHSTARVGYILLTIEGLTIATKVTQNQGEGLHLSYVTPATGALNLAPAAGTGSFEFGTNSPEAPVIKYSTTGQWADATETVPAAASWFTAGATTKSTYGSLNDNKYTTAYSYTANPSDTEFRGSLYIHARVEDDATTDKIYTVTQNPPSENCYMVKPGGTVTIPLDRAVTYGGAGATATLYASKLWDDNSAVTSFTQPVGTGAAATLTVTAGSNMGNAVVAVRITSTSGTIVWSYHIWVTDFVQDYGWYNTLNTNNPNDPIGYGHFTFMQRNLGATTGGLGSGKGYGLFYQWGRKDPFPATGDPTTDNTAVTTGLSSGSWMRTPTSATNGTVANTIKNPSVFYTAGSTTGYDWYWGDGTSSGSARNNTLWGHGIETAKSPYDPCPAGWRVPSHNVAASGFPTTDTSPWAGFADSSSKHIAGQIFANGYTWTNAPSNTTSYPATGCRYYSFGTLNFVGSYGYCWSASPLSSTSNYASILNFNSSNVNVSLSSYRASGYVVRCVENN